MLNFSLRSASNFSSSPDANSRDNHTRSVQGIPQSSSPHSATLRQSNLPATETSLSHALSCSLHAPSSTTCRCQVSTAPTRATRLPSPPCRHSFCHGLTARLRLSIDLVPGSIILPKPLSQRQLLHPLSSARAKVDVGYRFDVCATRAQTLTVDLIVLSPTYQEDKTLPVRSQVSNPPPIISPHRITT